MSKPDVTIVIPARNAAKTLGAVLEDLISEVPETVSIVVVDDHSSDDTAHVATTYCDRIPRLRVVRGAGNGPAAARNLGVRAADTAWIAFTDADVRIPPGWFAAGAAAATRGAVDVLEGPVTPSGGAERGLVRHSAWSDGRRRYVTANLWVRRETILAVGGFDEGYPAPWREDTDLGLRLEDAGANVETVESLRVLHPHYRGSVWSLFGKVERIHSDTRFRVKFGARTEYVMPNRNLNRSYITVAYLTTSLAAIVIYPSLATSAVMAVGTTELALWAVRMFLDHPAETEWRERALLVVLAPALVIWRVALALWSNLRYRTLFF